MKKSCLRVISVLLLIVSAAYAFSGCTKYSSNYKAVGFSHNNTSKHAEMSFNKFSGTMVFRLKVDEDSLLLGTGLIKTGSATVYYDDGNGKTELFTVRGGDDDFTPRQFKPEFKGTIYIIIETEGECTDGRLDFTVM